MALLNCQDGLTGQNIIDAINENTGKAEVSQIVAIGASIINGTFEDAVPSLQNSIKYGLSGVPVDNEGVGGNTATQLLARLPDILTTYDGVEGVVFIMHIGGNNVSLTRPYSSAELSELQTISSDINQIIDLIEAAGHKLFMANISYRYYDNGTAPEVDGSLPYNQNIIEPIIKSRLPESWDFINNKSLFDMYNWTKDNPSLMSADGVHPSNAGYDALCEWWFDRLSNFIKSGEDLLYTTSGTTVVVDFGSFSNDASGIYVTIDRKFSDVGSTLNVLGGKAVINNISGFSSVGGRGNIGDTSVSLTNNTLLESYVYTDKTNTFLNICNLEPNKTGVMNITSSRNSLDGTRLTDVTYDGVTETINPESITPEIISFNFNTGDYGVIQLHITKGAGSVNAYISGIELTFD